jgi:hypothetical protein
MLYAIIGISFMHQEQDGDHTIAAQERLAGHKNEANIEDSHHAWQIYAVVDFLRSKVITR